VIGAARIVVALPQLEQFQAEPATDKDKQAEKQ
jgi:hypothetical protein